MRVTRETSVTVALFVVLAAGAAALVTVLHCKRNSLLAVAARSAERATPTGVREYLNVHDAYGRLLDRFRENNPLGRPRPALASDPDFRHIIEEANRVRAARLRKGGGCAALGPLDFIAADALRMVGRGDQGRTRLGLSDHPAGQTQEAPPKTR